MLYTLYSFVENNATNPLLNILSMNCLEKEIKVLHINLLELIMRLEKLWAKRLGMWPICDHYYDRKGSDALTHEKKRARIRYGSEWVKVTLKKRLPSKGLKIADEEEFSIDNDIWVKSVFEERGLLPSRQKWKTRLTYVYGDIQYDIDMYPGIPPLVEIEAASEEKVQLWIALAGLENHQTTSVGAIGLMKRYWKTPLKLC